MENLDSILNKFTDPLSGSLHGAVFTAVDKSGNILYSHAAGKLAFDTDNASCMQVDSLCWIASMTKLATAVAVMQLVEWGLVTLDDDVRDLVPELNDTQVLQGFKQCSVTPQHQTATDSTMPSLNTRFASSETSQLPLLENIKGKLTLRHLLCHTSGFVYDSTSPLLQTWSKLQGREAHTFSGRMEGYLHPLVFQPGTSWGYGGGVDWAGRVIERVTKATLEEFMQANIWSRLGAKSTTFHPELNQGNLPLPLKMGRRVSFGHGSKSVIPGHIILKYPLQDDLGGIGLFSTPADFVKLLGALLSGGGPLLSRNSVDLLFQPQLNDESLTAMPKSLGTQMRRVLGINSIEDTGQADHSLAGTITLRDIPSRRRAGTVNWSGLPNLHWWIDRESGIAATLFTQLMPPGDSAVVDLLLELEKALYQAIQGKTEKVDGHSKL